MYSRLVVTKNARAFEPVTIEAGFFTLVLLANSYELRESPALYSDLKRIAI